MSDGGYVDACSCSGSERVLYLIIAFCVFIQEQPIENNGNAGILLRERSLATWCVNDRGTTTDRDRRIVLVQHDLSPPKDVVATSLHVRTDIISGATSFYGPAEPPFAYKNRRLVPRGAALL